MAEPITVAQDHWRYVQAAIKMLQDYTQLKRLLLTLSDVNITIESDLNGPYGNWGSVLAQALLGLLTFLMTIFTAFTTPNPRLAGLAHYFVQKWFPR